MFLTDKVIEISRTPKDKGPLSRGARGQQAISLPAGRRNQEGERSRTLMRPGRTRDLLRQSQKMADDEDYYSPLDRDRHSDALGGVEEDDNVNMFLNLAGDIEEKEGVGMDDVELLPPLKTIFDHPLITKCQLIDDKGLLVPAWRCGFCLASNNTFKGAPNATKALAHVTSRPRYDIRPCKGTIPRATMRQFERLFQERAVYEDQRAVSRLVVSDIIDDSQERCSNLWQIRGGVNKSRELLVQCDTFVMTPIASISNQRILPGLILLQIVPHSKLMLTIVMVASNGHGPQPSPPHQASAPAPALR
jgi:hypothetical protein